MSDKEKNNIDHLIGCTAVIDKDGYLIVHNDLETIMMSGRSPYPEYRIIGDDGKGNVILTTDGRFVSHLPKKYIVEIKDTNTDMDLSKGDQVLRTVRGILKTPEGEDVTKWAEQIIQRLDSYEK